MTLPAMAGMVFNLPVRVVIVLSHTPLRRKPENQRLAMGGLPDKQWLVSEQCVVCGLSALNPL